MFVSSAMHSHRLLGSITFSGKKNGKGDKKPKVYKPKGVTSLIDTSGELPQIITGTITRRVAKRRFYVSISCIEQGSQFKVTVSTKRPRPTVKAQRPAITRKFNKALKIIKTSPLLFITKKGESFYDVKKFTKLVEKLESVMNDFVASLTAKVKKLTKVAKKAAKH